jgi:outer membrane protein assembly factor BamA
MRRLALALLLFCTAALTAQSIVAKNILFTGAPQYQPAELLKLSGLTPGARLTQPEIEAAMNKLDSSGLFAGIEFKTSGDTLTFLLEPRAKTQSEQAIYGNFVWYTPEQLNALVHDRVPLFNGTVPADGELAQQVQHALEAILKEQHGIDATVTSRGIAGGRIEYSITTPKVVVGELHIANVDFASDPQLTYVQAGISGSEYLNGITAKQVQGNVGAALEELGYLDQTVGPITLAEPKADRLRIVVDLNGTAVPGAKYTVSRVTFPEPLGTVSAKDFESEHAVKAGGPPAPSLVSNTVFGVRNAFHSHGFLDAAVAVTQQKDAGAHTIAFTFKAEPGQLYHMRSLVFAGNMTAQQQSILAQNWKLPKGAVYEERIADQSLEAKSVALVCGGPVVVKKLAPDKQTHEVDVSLACSTHPHP